jgi:uncharacterized cupin superfamily protein
MSKADELRQKLIRNFYRSQLEPFVHGELYVSETARLSDGTAARKLGGSFDIVPPGKMACPYHLHHAQEEMFVIIEGEGTLRVDGELLPITAGDVIFIPAGPEYPHHIINTSNAPLKYLSFSTQDRPEICEYPDSRKTRAWMRSELPGKPHVLLSNRVDSNLDYWDGEPQKPSIG